MSNLTFGVIADIQYADQEPLGQRFFRNVLNKLPAAIEEIRKHQPAFILNLGDTVDNGLKNFKPVLRLMPDDIRVYNTLGNHDYYLMAPSNYPKVRELLGMPADYYDFSAGLWRFILLDSNDIIVEKGGHSLARAHSLMSAAEASRAGHAFSWNGAVSDEQLGWLDDVLKNAKPKDKKS